MDYYKIQRSIFVSLLVVLSTSFVSNLPIVLTTSRVLAQSIADRKIEADRLMQQGLQQGQANQLEVSLQSFQKALIIYRDIKNRKGEAVVLSVLGLIYSGELQDYPKAIDYYKQSLAIAREIKDAKLEAQVPDFSQVRRKDLDYLNLR